MSKANNNNNNYNNNVWPVNLSKTYSSANEKRLLRQNALLHYLESVQSMPALHNNLYKHSVREFLEEEKNAFKMFNKPAASGMAPTKRRRRNARRTRRNQRK